MRSSQTSPIHHRAAENIAFIRDTLERSGTFTAVPGRGGVVMGLAAFAGAWLASRQPGPAQWLAVWIATGVVGFVTAAASMMLKARSVGMPLLAGPGRKFAFGLAPSLITAGLLTLALASRGMHGLLPPLWLLMYGTALLASGAFSIRPLAAMGGGFLVLGAGALIASAYGDLFLGLGFGGLNLGFGIWIWRHYGG